METPTPPVEPPKKIKEPSKLGVGISLALLIISGSYNLGYEVGKIQTAEKIQKEVDYWKKKSQQITKEVEIRYVDKVKEIVKWRTKNVKIIEVVPSKCELSNGWVHIHDYSAQGRDANATEAADDTSSGIKDTKALETIVDNYATCHQIRQNLIELQQWTQDQLNLNNKLSNEKEEKPNE